MKVFRALQWTAGVVARVGICLPFAILSALLGWLREGAEKAEGILYRAQQYLEISFPMPWMTDLESADTKHRLKVREQLLEKLGGC